MGKIVVAVSLMSALMLSTAMAAEPAQSAEVDAKTYKPKTKHDNTPWRFNMEQNGERMTADQFDAWMKKRGVRVATGKPAKPEGGAPVKQAAEK